MINVEVEKGSSETNTSVIRRFTKRVQGAGILPRVRSLRYHARDITKFVQKKRALRSLARKKEVQLLIKLGKMVDRTNRE